MIRWFHLVLLSGFFFLALLTDCGAEGQINGSTITPTKQPAPLTLEDCVNTALKNHPDIIAALNTVQAFESRIGQARSAYYPQIDLSTDYMRYTPTPSLTSHFLNQYTTQAKMTQTVYDFGRTASQVSVQKLNADSSQYDLANVQVQIVFNVKDAYYGLLKTKRDKAVNDEIVNQFEQHLKQAQGFYEEGLKPKFDVTKAAVDLSNAQLNQIKAANAVKIAELVLINAMGLSESTYFDIKDNLSFEKYKISFEDAIRRAYAVRPDLLSLQAKKSAAAATISLSKKDYYPILSANAAYAYTNMRFPLDNQWSFDIAITFPLFSGFQTKYKVEEADANLRALEANEVSLKERIMLDVRQAYLNVLEAESRISTASLAVKQAEENLDLANGRYEAGIGNPIEVTDAMVSFSNAKTAYTQALYDYKIAQASVEKAMGIK